LVNEVYEPFMQSGTMHIFAISGLHVALIAGILVALLRLIRLPRRWCGLVVVPLLWFYTAATGWQASAIRASIMMTVIILGWVTARPTDLINSLAAAALVILVWDPQQLFQASFQLSFGVVLSIGLLAPRIKNLCDKLLAHDPLIPREALPWWRRGTEAPLRWLAMSLATSIAAWLGSLPLTIYYFHIFSPVTLLANLLVVPMSGAALASSMGSLICGAWLPTATEWFNHGSWFWMSGMMEVSRWAAALPSAFRYVATPPLWSFAAYYVALIGGLSGWFFRAGNRIWLLFAIFIATCAGYWEWKRAQDAIEITVLPLHGGHAVYVDAPGTGDDWLMDCGNENAAKFVIKPFLRARGMNHLPRLLLTHGDLQHIGGAKLIWDEFNVEKTYTGPVSFRSGAYRELLDHLTDTPERHVEISRSDKAGQWTVLHPSVDDKFAQADDGCLVLQARLHKTRILLLGDLGRPGQELLMQRYPYLDADIVVTGLPEKGEPMCNGLIGTTHPKRTIVADAEIPATKRANGLLKQRLNEMGAKPVFTREQGAVRITVRPEGFELRSAAQTD
jgi:ComEC/Rec2-related protein